MRYQIAGRSGDSGGRHFAATQLVNDSIAIDAGLLGLLPLEQQWAVEHVLLTHVHLDHVGTLPLFLDNVYQRTSTPVTVLGSAHVLAGLRQHFFNDVVWPDLERISAGSPPFCRFMELQAFEDVDLNGIRVTPVPLDHVVPTFGFLLDDGHSAIVHVSDTRPTSAIWDLARQVPHLRGVALEASFPNAMSELAHVAGHLTPQLFAGEYRKLQRDVPVAAIHLKPTYHNELLQELQDLSLPQLILPTANQVLNW